MDSVHAISSDVQTGSRFKSKDGFISLSLIWNKALQQRFGNLFEDKGTSIDPLRFHISDENREKTQQLWNINAGNIGLLEL